MGVLYQKPPLSSRQAVHNLSLGEPLYLTRVQEQSLVPIYIIFLWKMTSMRHYIPALDLVLSRLDR